MLQHVIGNNNLLLTAKKKRFMYLTINGEIYSVSACIPCGGGIGNVNVCCPQGMADEKKEIIKQTFLQYGFILKWESSATQSGTKLCFRISGDAKVITSALHSIGITDEGIDEGKQKKITDDFETLRYVRRVRTHTSFLNQMIRYDK